MFMVVTGNVEPYDIIKLVEDNLKEKKLPTYKNPKTKKYREESKIVNSYTELEGNVLSSKVKMSVKTPISAFKNIDDVELRLMTSLIIKSNFGPTSDLKEDLMEKNLINYMSANRSIIGDYLIMTITIETNYPKEVIKEIKEQLKKLEITEENLKRKINASIASMVLMYDDIINVNSSIQEEILSYGTIIDNLKEHLENISLEKVNKVIKKIDVKNLAITVLNPKK